MPVTVPARRGSCAAAPWCLSPPSTSPIFFSSLIGLLIWRIRSSPSGRHTPSRGREAVLAQVDARFDGRECHDPILALESPSLATDLISEWGSTPGKGQSFQCRPWPQGWPEGPASIQPDAPLDVPIANATLLERSPLVGLVQRAPTGRWSDPVRGHGGSGIAFPIRARGKSRWTGKPKRERDGNSAPPGTSPWMPPRMAHQCGRMRSAGIP